MRIIKRILGIILGLCLVYGLVCLKHPHESIAHQLLFSLFIILFTAAIFGIVCLIAWLLN